MASGRPGSLFTSSTERYRMMQVQGNKLVLRCGLLPGGRVARALQEDSDIRNTEDRTSGLHAYEASA